MEDELFIRRYLEGDDPNIVKLLDLVFNGWPKLDLRYSSLDYWRWRYLDNPIGNKELVVCENNDGEIVGCLHSCPKKIKVGKGEYLCSTGPDLAVHPEYRKRGIANRMIKKIQSLRRINEEWMAFYDTSNPILIKMSEKYIIFPYKQNIYVKINDIDLHLENNPTDKQFLEKYGYLILKNINKRIILGRKNITTSNNYEILEINEFDLRVYDFWLKIKKYYNFIERTNPITLNWRYKDMRGGKYIVKTAIEKDEIIGYIVLRINRYNKNYAIGYIVEIKSIQNRPEVTNSLIEEALNYFDEQNINIIQCLVIDDYPYKKALGEHNFLNSRRNIYSYYEILKPINQDIQLFQQSPPNKIDMPFGFYDWI
jgi:GNAT superfamily N-acetyltransferase